MVNITIDEPGVRPSKELWFFVAFTPQSCWVFWAAGVIKLGAFNGKIMGKSWENHWKMWEHHGKMWANMGKTMKPHYKWRFFFGVEKHRKTWLVDFFVFHSHD